MSNSSLISYTKISPNRTSPRNHTIDTITIHHMAGDLTIEDCGAVFAPSARQASSNYGIGSDGRIGMYVEESDASWCTSSSSNDNRAVTIEVANDGGESTGWHVSDKALNSLIKLCADICRRNDIKKLKWRADPSLIGDSFHQNMTVHQWFQATLCPGPYLYGKHSYIASEVNKLLDAPYHPEDDVVLGQPQSVYNPSNPAYSYIDPTALVDSSKLTPYIATLDSKVTQVDYTKLKLLGVVGVMIHGGSYYDTMHNVRHYYRSDNIKTQVADADKHDMPYGLYVDVRARSEAEATLECRQLWYIVSKYPPKLGVWLRIETRANIDTNNKILEVYESHFVKWGLKDKFGLYITRSQLSSISWNKFYDRYLLWLVDPISTTAEIDGLLDPEFFMLKE